MGYESKLIVVNRDSNSILDYVWAEVIAEFKMSCLPWNHRDIFQTPIDFDIYVNGEPTRKDCYGEHCQMAKPDYVADVLEEMAKEENYRRYSPVIGMLRGFDKNEWDDLEVIHYGY